MSDVSGAPAGRRVHRRLVLIASAITVATGALSAAPVGAVSPTPYNTNLVKNPGFEAGAASPTGYTVVAVPNWITPQASTVVAYGAPDFPTKKHSKRIGGGHNFFSAGPHTGSLCGWGDQSIPIVGRDAKINSGHVQVTVKGLLGSYDHQSDTAVLKTYFLDNGGQAIGDAIDLQKTNTNGKLQPVLVSIVVPVATRTILIRLWSENVGGYCDAYFDNISVKLSKI